MRYILVAVIFSFFTASLEAQESVISDKNLIHDIRSKSNLALKSHHIDTVISLLTDDINIAASNGKIFSGKEEFGRALRDVFNTNPDLYYVRSSEEVLLNKDNSIAWEKGNWVALRPESKDWDSYGGLYSAYWIKKDGTWKIKSELFVRLN